MSKSCKGLAMELVKCLSESDCVKISLCDVWWDTMSMESGRKSISDPKFIISEIRFPDQVLLLSNQTMARDCNSSTDKERQSNVSFDLGEPFKVSSTANRIRALGCDTTAFIVNEDSNFGSRCDTQWIINSAGKKRHGGLGQCQIALPYNSSGYNYSVTDMFDYTDSACWRTCSYADEVLDRFPNNQIPLVQKRPYRECAGEKSPCISSECVGLRETYFNCKRGQVDMRARIRGNKGY